MRTPENPVRRMVRAGGGNDHYTNAARLARRGAGVTGRLCLPWR